MKTDENDFEVVWQNSDDGSMADDAEVPSTLNQSRNEPAMGNVLSAPEGPVAKPAKSKNSTHPRETKTKNDAVAKATAPRTKTKPKNEIVREPDPLKLAAFQEQHAIVCEAAKSGVEAGFALKQIHDQELWRADPQFKNWNHYCATVHGMTRRYANMLIAAAKAIKTMREVGNKFPTCVPTTVTQVIPLLGLKDDSIRLQAWELAVKKAGGQKPAPKLVKEAVVEVLGNRDGADPAAPKTAHKTPAQRRATLIFQLKEAIKAQTWEDAERLVLELEDCI